MTNTWKNLQAFEQHSYREDFAATGSYLGHFSVPEFETTSIIRNIVETYHLCLDVGCGILPRPNYMGDKSVYYGIDPFFGEHKREFPFAQAVGEHLPFPSNTFDAVLLMSSLDHAIEPTTMLHEAKRVGGDIIIWTGLRSDADIARWKKSGRNFDKFHQWAFSVRSIKALLAKVGISIVSSKWFGGKPRKYPETHLIIGRT